MDLEQRLSHLEGHHEYYGMAEVLEQAIGGSADSATKAAFHLRLGRLLNERFLQGVRALKHFQDAFKLNPSLLEALEEARQVYWQIGKLNMVQKLIELELKTASEPNRIVVLANELGEVLQDQGQHERAIAAYQRALEQASASDRARLQALIEDLGVGEESWQERIAALLRSAHQTTVRPEKAACFLRAARIAARFAPDEVEGMLSQAYTADSSNPAVALLLETLLVQAERAEVILQLQQAIIEGDLTTEERVQALVRFGIRWALRHQNPDVAGQFLAEALRLDPACTVGLYYMRPVAPAPEGAANEFLALLDDVMATPPGQVNPEIWALAGLVAWKDCGDVIRARRYFTMLGRLDAEHPDLLAFELQLGTTLRDRSPAGETGEDQVAGASGVAVSHSTDTSASASANSVPSEASVPSAEPSVTGPALATASTATVSQSVAVAGPKTTAQVPTAVSEAVIASSQTTAGTDATGSRQTSDASRVAELRAQLVQQEESRKFHEVVKTLVALGDELDEPTERVEAYLRAAELYVGKFANQAEAVRVYERIIECEPQNPVAVDYLRQMYEKRRDWEKLIGLNLVQAKALDSIDERTGELRAIARMASERVKKPEICIELWQQVLEGDPSDNEALGALAQMYERAREFEKLASVLERQVQATFDNKERIAILTKLGQVVGDRLNDDERAVDAYRALLDLVPDDRRAQEQLKKRYTALGRWDDLEVFYAESGKWDEFIRILEASEAKAQDQQQRTAMLMKIAELWLVQKQKADRAAKAYEKVLQLDQDNLAAAERLIPIYTAQNSYKSLAAVVEIRLRHTEDEPSQLMLLRDLAGLYETKLSETEKALACALRVFTLAPEDEQSLDDLERVARVTGSWNEVVTAVRKVIDDGLHLDTDLIAALRLRLGKVLDAELGDVDGALLEFGAVRDLVPNHPTALEGLERLYRKTSRYAELLEVYQQRLDALEIGSEERKQVRFAIAELNEQQSGDVSAAIVTYEGVLEEDPTDTHALQALDRLYRQSKAWVQYAEVLRRRIELDVDEKTLVDLKYRLASVLLEEPGSEEEALNNYREILLIDPEHEGTRGALERLLENEVLRSEVAMTLEAIYESREDWDKLITTLEILANNTVELSRRVELLRKMALTAATRLGQFDRAIDAQARALAEDPTEEDARIELEGYAEQAQAHARLAEVYADIAKGLSDPVLARGYWIRLAALFEQQGQIASASECFEKVLELDPADLEALSAMDSLYRRTSSWAELVGVYRRRIELSQDAVESEELYSQMAEVLEQQLGKPAEAIAAYREVLALDPTSQRGLGALEGLFTRQGMWSELAENLESQLNLADFEESQIAIMLRLAALRLEQMGEAEAAIDGYRQVLEREPTNAVALAALEQLGQREEFELVVAEILEPIYRDQGDFARLIAVIEVQIRRADDAARRVELLQQVAELQEEAGHNPAAAFDTMTRALAVEPESESTLEALDRLARSTNRLRDLAEFLDRLASSQQAPDLGSRLMMAAGRIYEDDVQDVERAIGLYQRVLAIDPLNLGATDSLQALFQATSRFADMSLVLQRKAEILEDLDEQKAALYEAARLEEEVLERRENAIGVYLKVLEVDSEDLRSIDALIAIYLGLERWKDLLGVFVRKVDLVLDPEEKKLIYYQMGAVYERELGDVAQAIDTYQKVLELDPDDIEALGRLDVLYQAAENWQELLTILGREAELAQDPEESVGYQYRIAEIFDQKIADVERAVELYREILDIQPDHAPTLQALEAIKDSQRAPLAAAAVLEPIYEASSQWTKLISVLEVQVKGQTDSFAQCEILHRIASLYEESLHDHARAFDTMARAIVVDSSSEEALGSLERLATVTDRWSSVASLYDGEFEKLEGEPERFVELALRVAQIYEVQLENVDQAVARYRKVLKVEIENQSALRALDRLFTQTERWAELVDILSRSAELGETPDEILDTKFRLGQVYETRLGDSERAIETYREVIAAAPDHDGAISALEGLFVAGTRQVEVSAILEPLYQGSGEWEKLLQVHEAQLRFTEDPEERLAMYGRIAEDAEERLMDPVMAFGVRVRCIREFPLEERTGEEIERLAGMIDDGWKELANAYADVLGAESTTKEIQSTIGKRLARVYEEELSDIGRAEETYRYVLTVVERDGDALANLDRIYSGNEQWVELAGVLEQRVVAASEVSDRVEMCLRLGEVYDEQLGQKVEAVRAYRQVFDELEPTHEQAILALSRIYEETEQWTALREVFERQLENCVGDVEEAEIRGRLARLSADRLNNVAEAIEGWKRVLDLRGEDAEALWALADLYQNEGKWAELTDVLERHFDIADSDEERVSILTRRARLFAEQLNRDEEALGTWNRVLDIDYANAAALREVAVIWRKRGDATELVTALHALIDRASSLLPTEEVIAAYRELGRLYTNSLSQSYEASEAWKQLLELDPQDFEAMDALETIFRAEERWPDVIGIKMQRAEALPSVEERIRELLEVTELWKREAADYAGATPAYEAILRLDSTHTEAFECLEKLHGQAERWEALVELYLARLESRETVAEKSDLLRRIARVFDERLNDQNQAFVALVNAFAEDFSDDDTARYLEKMAQATNRWGELLSTANDWLPEQTEPRSKIQLCLRLGKWYGQDLGHPEWAQPYYQQIVQLDPNNVQVLRQMAAIHRVSGNWQKVGETLQRALDVVVSNDDRKMILVDMGELLERNMGQVEAGIGFYRRALEVDAEYLPALEALDRIFEAQNDAVQLVEVLSAKVRALRDDEQSSKQKLRMAQLYETSLRAPERAGQMYREVLEADAANLIALRGLERIDELTHNWADLVVVLERQLDVVETERERVELLLKLAAVLEEQFLKVDVATQRLEAVLEIDPSEERAYVALERCYRRMKQWLDLIGTFERHISETATQSTKIDLYGQIAQVFGEEVGDVERAIDAYQSIVDLDDTNIAALDALSKLFERQGDASRAIETMTRVADLTTDGQKRVEMYFRIGKALEEQLGDRIQAKERLEMALDLDPTHLLTLAKLRAIALDDSDWESAARYLDQEQLNTPQSRARAKLLVELGRLRDEKLEEHELAVQAYEAAIQADPDCEEAALPLVEEYVRTEHWVAAEPLAEMLVKKAKSKDRHEQHVLHKLLGRVLAALGHDDRALKAYQTAHQLDLTDQETIRGIADAAFKLRDWPTSLTNYQKVLTALGEDEVLLRTETYYRLGCIKREQGQVRQGINNFEKALALNTDHRPTLDALVEVYAKNNDFKQVAAYKRQILDTVTDTEQRVALLLEIGDVWSEKEKNWAKAMEPLEEALDLRGQDHIILHKLLQLYQRAGEWEKMVDCIQRINELETRPEVKAKYLYTQAQLYRDKLNDTTRAIDLFNASLDLNPAYLEAFERINKILTQEKDWKQLERAYRKMILRISGKGNAELEHQLWHQLGLIYRDRLQQGNEAIESFKMAATLKPDNGLERQILAELYETAERWDEAIAEQRAMLLSDPLKVEVYRALYRLFLYKQSYDEAWCVASAISFLGEASEEERQFYLDWRPEGMLPFRGRMNDDLWNRQLFHPDTQNHVSSIFEMIVPAALQAKSAELKAGGKLPSLDARFRQDPATSTVTFAKTFGLAAQVLGTPAPELYVRSDVPGWIVPVATVPPASVAGQTVLSGFQPQELAFICAKHLAGYRPRAYIRNLFATQSELTIMFFAGVALAVPSTPLPAEIANNVKVSAQALRRFMQPVEFEHLQAAVKRWMGEGSTANMRRWIQGIEVTTTRAGLLLCGDLEIAKRVIAAETSLPGDLTAAEKMKELLLFSVSEEYMALRRSLGVAIKVE